MSSIKGRYEIFRGEDDLWYFNRIAGNNEIEHPSEGYVSRGNAVRAIGTCMEDTSHYVITDREEPEKDEPMHPRDFVKQVEREDTQRDYQDFYANMIVQFA